MHSKAVLLIFALFFVSNNLAVAQSVDTDYLAIKFAEEGKKQLDKRAELLKECEHKKIPIINRCCKESVHEAPELESYKQARIKICLNQALGNSMNFPQIEEAEKCSFNAAQIASQCKARTNRDLDEIAAKIKAIGEIEKDISRKEQKNWEFTRTLHIKGSR